MARRCASHVAVLFVVCLGTASATATTNATTDHTFEVFRFNEFLGPQSRHPGLHGALALVPTCEPDESLDCGLVRGRVALCVMEHSHFFGWSHQQRHTQVFQECGALGVLKAWRVPAEFYGTAPLVGFQYHVRDGDCCRGSRRISIPVLVAWHSALWPAISVLERNQSATVVVDVNEVDRSVWEKHFSSALFFTLHRVAVPLLCVVPLLTALRAIVLHRAYWAEAVRKSRSGSRSRARRNMRSIATMVGVLCVYVLGCVIRIVYGLGGPIHSNGTFSFNEHVYLGLPGVSVWVQTFGVAAGICVLRQWGRIKAQSRRNVVANEWFEAMVIGTALVLIAGVVSLVEGMRSAGLRPVVLYLWAEKSAYLLLLLINFAGLLVFKKRFNTKLKGTNISRIRERTGVQRSSALESRRRKTTLLMSLSVLSMSIEVTVLGLTLFPSLSHHPMGWTLLWFVFHTLATLSAQFQCLAFTPRNTSKPWLGAFRPHRRGSMDSDASASEIESFGGFFGVLRAPIRRFSVNSERSGGRRASGASEQAPGRRHRTHQGTFPRFAQPQIGDGKMQRMPSLPAPRLAQSAVGGQDGVPLSRQGSSAQDVLGVSGICIVSQVQGLELARAHSHAAKENEKAVGAGKAGENGIGSARAGSARGFERRLSSGASTHRSRLSVPSSPLKAQSEGEEGDDEGN